VVYVGLAVLGEKHGSAWRQIRDEDAAVKATGRKPEDEAGGLSARFLRADAHLDHRLFFEASADGMLLGTADGDVLDANAEACRMLRWAREELLFADLGAIFDQTDPRLDGARAEQRDTNRFMGELNLLRRDGTPFPAEVSISLYRDGGEARIGIVLRDITEHKRLEERLRSSLSTLVAIHEAGRVISSTLELEEMGIRLLEIARRVSNLSAAVINLRDERGRLCTLHAFGPESLWWVASTTPEVQDARRGALETGERRLFKLEQSGEGGTPIVGLCLPLVVRDRVTGVLEAYGSNDLAEKTTAYALESLARQAASALENARLYRELVERERQLRNLVGKLLVAQEEERRRVACDIHDGLTQIAVAAYQHLQAYAEDHAPVCSSSQKMDQILKLSAQTVEEARRVIADLRPMALDDLGLATTLRLWVDSLGGEGWEIGYEEALGQERLPAEIETVLYRVAQEALTNVRKHALTTRARIKLRRLGGSVYLEVRDWGRGFDGAVPPEGEATGERVGLCGMRERVALIGGEFRIHSRPGAGTSVVAEIPLLDAVPVHDEPLPSPRRETSPPAQLVVADDQAIVREGLRTMLAGEQDFEVVGEATDGREALELCRNLKPDLVLMDVRMPRMDGLAATRAITSEGCATSILMLSTYENPDYLFEAVQAGASGYVIKDAGKRELVGVIRGALGGENPLNQRLAMQLLRRLASGDNRTTASSSGPGKQPEPLREPLTPREVEVLRFLAQGQTNRQISRQLVVSPATVKVHVEHILAKLGASDRTQAAVRASEAGLLNATP
jgi:PAS domain S-box-containing protein